MMPGLSKHYKYSFLNYCYYWCYYHYYSIPLVSLTREEDRRVLSKDEFKKS